MYIHVAAFTVSLGTRLSLSSGEGGSLVPRQYMVISVLLHLLAP